MGVPVCAGIQKSRSTWSKFGKIDCFVNLLISTKKYRKFDLLPYKAYTFISNGIREALKNYHNRSKTFTPKYYYLATFVEIFWKLQFFPTFTLRTLQNRSLYGLWSKRWLDSHVTVPNFIETSLKLRPVVWTQI